MAGYDEKAWRKARYPDWYLHRMQRAKGFRFSANIDGEMSGATTSWAEAWA